jgi:prevent-host-death family protein
MNTRTEFQVIVGQDGKPAFVVVPYEEFRRMKGGFEPVRNFVCEA